MAKPVVFRSIEAPGGARCVDIFCRPDGTWGFEEYRRDPEENHGWFPIGGFSGLVFPGQDTAMEAALAEVGWLSDVT